ncbi:MAG TPA: YciI family protein [Xanthomonadaceae bacterium]|nr:YciI family protein [Xanthomonadaceae bacterium]
MKRFLVLTLRRPQFDPALIAPHYAHLDGLRARGALELYGPFGDRSGGAYVLRAESLEQAQAMAFADPLHVTGASEVSVREWNTA